MASATATTLLQAADAPDGLRAIAERLVADTPVSAVVLFGSRARGNPHEYSDWDLALVCDESDQDEVRQARCYSADYRLESVVVTTQALRQRNGALGTIWHAIPRQGRLLAGKLDILLEEETYMEKGLLLRYLDAGLEHLVNAALGLATEQVRGLAGGYKGAQYSADGAEFIAKALCFYQGITPEHSHDLRALSKQFDDPFWRSRVSALNGDTPALHAAWYSGNVESVERTEARLLDALQLCLDLLGLHTGERPVLDADEAKTLYQDFKNRLVGYEASFAGLEQEYGVVLPTRCKDALNAALAVLKNYHVTYTSTGITEE